MARAAPVTKMGSSLTRTTTNAAISPPWLPGTSAPPWKCDTWCALGETHGSTLRPNDAVAALGSRAEHQPSALSDRARPLHPAGYQATLTTLTLVIIDWATACEGPGYPRLS